MHLNYRFSGHETFPCRYAWLPKAFLALTDNDRLFSNEEDAMVELGIGKNMANAAKFWVLASRIGVQKEGGGIETTTFGQKLLAPEGYDPFLEDIKTLWLIHWNLTTHFEEPLFAWDFMLNRWQRPEFIRSEIIESFKQEAERLERKFSPVTLAQHFDVFLHTYVSTRSRKGEILEDNLDCPLVELDLIRMVGHRGSQGVGKREPIYAFNRNPKPEITGQLFAFCLDEYWDRRFKDESTLSFRNVTITPGSPGQIFKLPEADVRDRLDKLEEDSKGVFAFRESATQQHIFRNPDKKFDLLGLIYGKEEAI